MKLFIKVFLALIIILIIAVIGIAMTFNPNDYKEEIISLVKEKTGRELLIKGDISLSLFPWIGVDLGAIEISNAKGFGKQPFAKMEHLQVRAKLWPLFKQQLEADTLVIEGLTLNLAKNKRGISNWDDLSKTTKPSRPESKTKSVNNNNQAKTALAAFALNGIEIKQARFNWHDKQQNQKVTIKDIQLRVAKLRPESKVPFSIAFYFQEKSLDAKVNFNSEITFSPDFKQFSFYDTQLTSKIKLATIKKALTPQFNSPLIDLNLKQKTFNAKALTLSLSSVKLQTQVAAKQILSNPHVNGRIILQKFNPRELANSFAIKLPTMADKSVLTQLSAQLDIKGRLNNINISNLELELDDTKMIGQAKIKPAPASSSVTLLVDNINLDRYLPKAAATKTPQKKSKPTKTSSKNTSAEAALIPVALLNAVNLDSNFKIKKIQIKKTHWTDFNFITHAKNGQIQIKPLSMHGYDATIKSNFKIKALKNNALLSGNLNIQNMKAGKLLNDLTGKDKLKGQTSVVASFNTSGIKLSQLKQNLNGKLKLNLKDGTLKGFDLNHQLNVLDAKIKGKTIPATPKPKQTKIAKLSASAIIKNGILNNKDLRASTPLSRIIGRGTVDIVKEKLNYTATLKFTSSTDIKFNTPFEKMKSFPLDVLIRGTFDKPVIKVDFKKVLDQAVKKELKKQEQKIKEKVTKDLKKAIEKNLDKQLKDLLKF